MEPKQRNLVQFNPSAWTYDDQKTALEQGFNSVTEWGLWRVVTEIIPGLEARIEELEGRQDAQHDIIHGKIEDAS